jgi:hypothetical protein
VTAGGALSSAGLIIVADDMGSLFQWLAGTTFWQSYRRWFLVLIPFCLLLGPFIARLKKIEAPISVHLGLAILVSGLFALRFARNSDFVRKRKKV